MIELEFRDENVVGQLKRIGEREYQIIAFEEARPSNMLIKEYECEYPTLFGIDVYDMEQISIIGEQLIIDLKNKLIEVEKI